jgi:hypothetical protein
VYRLQKIASKDDGNTPIIMLRRGQIVVPLPAPRRLLIRHEAVDVANGDGLVSILKKLRASILATLKERNKGPPDPDVEGGKGGKGVKWHSGVALDFEDETAATKAAHRLRARVLSPDCRILREKLKGGDVATRVTLVGVPLTISTIDDILGSGDDVYVYTASSFNELAVDFASPADAHCMVDRSSGALRLPKNTSCRIEGHLDFCDVRDTDGWVFDAFCGIQGEVGALCKIKKNEFGARTSAADDLYTLWHDRPFSLCEDCHKALHVAEEGTPRVPRNALANNMNLGWTHVDEVSLMHGSFHANLDLYKVTKGELSLTERLSCNDHWASGGGVLRIATPGEAAASVKWDQSRKRGITGNFTAVYQPSSVSES